MATIKLIRGMGTFFKECQHSEAQSAPVRPHQLFGWLRLHPAAGTGPAAAS
jgi:hypothetical protein